MSTKIASELVKVARDVTRAEDFLRDEWLTRDQVAEICPDCADRMGIAGVDRIRASVIEKAASDARGMQADKWKTKPKGWTDESRKKFWESLTGRAPKHKVTACINKMEGKVGDAGAFCASLADRVTGKKWRSASDKQAANGRYFQTVVEQVKDGFRVDTLNAVMTNLHTALNLGEVPEEVVPEFEKAYRILSNVYKERQKAFNIMGRVIHKNKLASDVLKVAKDMVAYVNFENEIEGDKMRFMYDDFASFRLEELPAKGKKRLRTCEGSVNGHLNISDLLNMSNLMRFAKIKKSMSYDQAKKAIDKAVDELYELVNEDVGRELEYRTLFNGPYEKSVHFLQIEPKDTKPFTADGKDFTVSLSWTKFHARDSDDDMGGHDPSYTDYVSKSAAAGRKMYKIMSADPKALSSVKISDFSDWLRKNGVAYDLHFSVWR